MSPDPTSSAFVVAWAADRLRAVGSSGWVGRPLPWLFGGPHISHPSLTKADVSAGDRVFPLSFKGGRIVVLCECVVHEIIPLDEFRRQFRIVKTASVMQDDDLRDWLRPQRCSWLAPTCTDDAVLLRSCTPVAVDRFVPLEQVPAFRLLNARGERKLSNVLPDGHLKNLQSLHGRYYKASPATAAILSGVCRAS
jgi:hypothetical protein